MNSIPSENRSPSERCDQREDNLCLGISEAVPTAGPSVWNDGGNQTAEEGWSGAAVHRRGEMGLPPPRWDSRVELVEEGGETRLPEEEFQEAPKGFGLSKWKNGCHSPSPQPPSPGKVGFGKSPVRRESKIPASIPRSSTSRTLREARCGGGVAEGEGTVPGGQGSLPRKRVPGCPPARPATHLARRW